MKLEWRGPYDYTYARYTSHETTGQEYRLYIGSLVYLGSLYGLGGQYSGTISMPAEGR